MFLPRPQFHVNYYGDLDRNGVWLNYNKVIGYCEKNNRDNVDFGSENTARNNDQSRVPVSQTRKGKQKQKNPKKNTSGVHGQFEEDRFYLTEPPKNQSAHLPATEKVVDKRSNPPQVVINKNRNRSLIDAYKPSETGRNELIKELQDHLKIGQNSDNKIGVTVTSKYKSNGKVEQQMVKSKISPPNDPKQPQNLEHENHTKGGNLSEKMVPAHRVSVTRDPVNAQRIQQCEQAKLMARYASDKTGISLTDIYTGRISLTEKPKVKPGLTEEKEAWQRTEDTNEAATVCFTQPVANPQWNDKTVGFYDNGSSSSDWTTSSSGCETEEPITLEEVREHMCYYVLCCGLCID